MSDDLRTRLKAFARDCVVMGDMGPLLALGMLVRLVLHV